MDPKTAFRGETVTLTRHQLLSMGVTANRLAAEVHAGSLVRVRRGHYALPRTHPAIVAAVRIGGKVACVSAAELLGIWAPRAVFPHVHLRHEASRLRSPGNRFALLDDDNRDGCDLHWWPLIDERRSRAHQVSALDAVAQIIRCQRREIAIAALDSALHLGLVRPYELDRLFEALPVRFAGLREDLDDRSMSGLESIVRLIARDAGLDVELQRYFDGVGSVDLVIAGCVVVETDGRKFHENTQNRDYRRDVLLAKLGYTVLRFNYELVMFHPELVLDAILTAVRNHARSAR